MNEDESVILKSLRIRKCDYIKISELCKEFEITQAQGVKMLLDNYSKVSKFDVDGAQDKVLLKLLEYRDGRIQQIKKQFLKILEEKMNLEEKIKELEIKNKM